MTSTLCPQPSCLLLVQVPSGVDPALEEQQRHPLQSCPGRQRTDTTVLSSERLAGAWGPVGHRVCPWTWPHALSLDGAGDCFRGWDVPAEWVASSTGQKPSREPMKTRVAWRRGPALSSFLPAPGPRPTAQVTGRSAAPELQQGRFQGLGQRQASAHRQPRPARFLRMVNTQTLLRFTFCSLLCLQRFFLSREVDVEKQVTVQVFFIVVKVEDIFPSVLFHRSPPWAPKAFPMFAFLVYVPVGLPSSLFKQPRPERAHHVLWSWGLVGMEPCPYSATRVALIKSCDLQAGLLIWELEFRQDVRHGWR